MLNDFDVFKQELADDLNCQPSYFKHYVEYMSEETILFVAYKLISVLNDCIKLLSDIKDRL